MGYSLMKINIIYICCSTIIILAIILKVSFDVSSNIVLPAMMISWAILILLSESFKKKSKIILVSILLLMSAIIIIIKGL